MLENKGIYLYLHINSEDIILISVVTVVIERLRVYLKKNIFFYFLFVFPFVFLHELTHFIISLLMGGKPRSFKVFPKKTQKGISLGEVSSENINFINAFPISMAPLLLFGSLFFWENYFNFFGETIYSYILFVYIIVNVTISAIPSSQDIKVAMSNFGFLVWVPIIAITTMEVFNVVF